MGSRELRHLPHFQKFGFSDSWHTRGFYERAAVLYHHARGTPPKRLFWVPVTRGVGGSTGNARIGVRDPVALGRLLVPTTGHPTALASVL
jgi:hypothetical protein